jgi:curved DNA-binding protein CbpA
MGLDPMSFNFEHGLFKLELTDYHAILGLPLDADANQIRKRYLKIAHNLHPDTCKAETPEQKKLASEILSKLVNPAYENLYKDRSRLEYQIILSQIGKRLSTESSKITIASDAARELYRADQNIDFVYKRLVEAFAQEQYKSVKNTLTIVSQISELNLIYLMVKQGQGIQPKFHQTATSVANSSKKPSETPVKDATPTAPPPPPPETEKQSPAAPYLRRAEEYIGRKNYAKAILELREALKVEPNNVNCHSFAGLAYLKQQQTGMAKVHINKALQLNPKDEIALKCQQEIERLDPKNKSKSSSQSGGGLFGGLFGGKKK